MLLLHGVTIRSLMLKEAVVIDANEGEERSLRHCYRCLVLLQDTSMRCLLLML